MKDHNVYADYGIEKDDMLDDNLVETVEKLANTKPIKTDLTIHFLSKSESELSKIDKKRFKTAYKNTINQKLFMKNHEISRCLMTGLVFFAIAVILAAVYVVIEPHIGKFFNQFCYIIEWVFICTTVQTLTIELIQLYIDRAKLKRLLKAKIIFRKKVRRRKKVVTQKEEENKILAEENK